MLSSCPVCRGEESRFHLEKAGYRFVRCLECGLVYLDPMPTEQELQEFYETTFYTEDWARAIGHPERHYFEKRTAEELRSYVPLLEGLEQHALPGRLLDVGCGDGSFLGVASSRGWRVEGIEPSPKAVEFCRKSGFQVRQDFPGEDTAIDAAYDAVTSIVTIEHLRDPRALVRFAWRALRPGGVFLVTTINVDSEEARREGANWHNYAPPGHVVHFSRESLVRLIREKEFEILGLETNPAILRFAPPSCGFWGAVRRTLPWRDPIRRVYHRVREGLAAASRREGPDLFLYARKPATAGK